MRRQGILVLGLAAAVMTASASGDTGNGILDRLSATQPQPARGAELLDYELAKRVYFYRFMTGQPLDAISGSDSGQVLADDDVSYTLPEGFLDVGMEQFAAAMLADSRLNKMEGLGDSWLMLAKRASEQNHWSLAGQLVARALAPTAHLTAESVAEGHFIAATAAANQNQIESATEQLAQIDTDSDWSHFAAYNLMLAQMRKGLESAELLAWVDDYRWANPGTPDQIAFNDRLNLTAAKYELRNKRYDSAIELLRVISKDSPYTADALLQYGWTLSKRWQYDQALQPWRVLQENFEPLDVHVLESLMATSYIAELLQGSVESLPVYEYSERRLSKVLQRLGQLSQPELLQKWVTSWSGNLIADDNNQQYLTATTGSLTASRLNRELEGLLSSSDFIEARQQLADIKLLQQWTATASSRLEKVQQQRLANQQSWADSSELDAMAEQVTALQAKVEQQQLTIQQQQLALVPFANANENARLEKLATVHAAANGDTPLENQLRAQAEFLSGVQLWQAAKAVPARQWQQQKQLLQLQAQHRQLRNQLLSQRQLAVQNTEFMAETAEQDSYLSDYGSRLNDFRSSLDQLEQQQGQQVVAVAQQHLTNLTDRLKHYLATTRLAIARIYDQEFRRNNAAAGGSTDHD
ncbi:hypothetical protein [Oceanobacter mangrovi]|uniref:hypothetical protein n=1 Tax=Oceanobacter mangrovi TaxID=2862510 RepID=UPI001C8DD14F|nr:hypothetical protein [Oceanobacter mangrovi]